MAKFDFRVPNLLNFRVFWIIHGTQLIHVHDPLFYFLFLHPFRHRFGAANQNHSEIFGTAERSEMADFEQMKKIVRFITCEIPLCQDVCKLVLGVDVFDLNLGVKLILSNNQLRATLWVLDTCLIVGLLLLIIIFTTASLSSNTYNIAVGRKFRIRGHTVNVKQIGTVARGWCFGLILGALA